MLCNNFVFDKSSFSRPTEKYALPYSGRPFSPRKCQTCGYVIHRILLSRLEGQWILLEAEVLTFVRLHVMFVEEIYQCPNLYEDHGAPGNVKGYFNVAILFLVYRNILLLRS
jgi:hypothetical protein